MPVPFGAKLPVWARIVLTLLFLLMIKPALTIAMLGLVGLGLGGWVEGVPLTVVMVAASLVLFVAAILVLATGRRGWMTVGSAAAAVPLLWIAYFWLNGSNTDLLARLF